MLELSIAIKWYYEWKITFRFYGEKKVEKCGKKSLNECESATKLGICQILWKVIFYERIEIDFFCHRPKCSENCNRMLQSMQIQCWMQHKKKASLILNFLAFDATVCFLQYILIIVNIIYARCMFTHCDWK